VAVLGSIGAAVYRGQVVVPADVPTAAATAARESITGAVSVSSQFPDLLASAREAFTSGLHVAAAVGVVLFAAMAVLAVTTLRGVRPTGAETGAEATPDPEPEAAPVPAA
jgi:MFS transporter, DHA2 family, multidrug resistance protein